MTDFSSSMQQAFPYRSWQPAAAAGGLMNPPAKDDVVNRDRNPRSEVDKDVVRRLVRENAVIVFGKKGCCMSHVVKRLLQGLGVNPVVVELAEEETTEMLNELSRFANNNDEEEYDLVKDGNDRRCLNLPAVFVGGSLFGGLERVMATHISGELVPILKDAGALWL